jgi:hypothetical protein
MRLGALDAVQRALQIIIFCSVIRFSGKGWHAAPFLGAHFGLNVCYGKSTSLCGVTSLVCVTVGVMKTRRLV